MVQLVEIYFDDLTEVKQKEVLDLYGLKDSYEGNFEFSPIAIRK